MGKFQGDYSVDGGLVFDESRRITTLLQMQNSPLVDVLMNTASHAVYTHLRRLIQSTFKNGTPFGAFTIEQKASAKEFDFTLVAGTGSYTASGLSDAVNTKTSTEVPTGPARFFVGGHVALLPSDRDWKSPTVVGSPEIHSVITALSTDTVVDSSAFFGKYGDDLVGQYFCPNINDTGSPVSTPKLYPISDWTANSITVTLGSYYYYNPTSGAYAGPVVDGSVSKLSDITEIGQYYRIEPSAAGVSLRADSIYLDVYLDEMDKNDDSIVRRAIGGVPVDSANFGFVKQRLEWIQGYNGGTANVSGVSDGSETAQNNLYEILTDSDGNVHHRVLLAVIKKQNAGTAIQTADITLYHNNPLWGLTVGSLPSIGTGSLVDGTAAQSAGSAGSTGSNATAGSYNGSALRITDLLLQMLGNVTDDQNKAFQNMGDYNDGTDRAGAPGIGQTATSLTDGRHVALVSNTEQAALIKQDMTYARPAYNNQYLTVGSHKGHPAAGAGNSLTAGAAHSNHATYANTVDAGVVNSDQAFVLSAPPAPIIIAYMQTDDSLDFGTGYVGTKTFNMGMDISSYSTIGQLRSHYTLLAIPVSRCAVKDSHMHLTSANPFGKSSDGYLTVTADVHQFEDQFHMSVLVIGIARGP